MNAKKVAAQFTVFTWIKECTTGRQTSDVEAWRFARENWRRFLACSTEGLGRLLIQLSGGRRVDRQANASGTGGLRRGMQPPVLATNAVG